MAVTFTAADHLWVQKAIENRAYEIWLADNHNPCHRLDHWLRAEAQVVADFCQHSLANDA